MDGWHNRLLTEERRLPLANIRHNLAYSALLTMSTYLVPLILFPYISRVLGIENIGRIDTIDNLMDYCILFSMMGLTSVGIREIAKNKDNPETLGQTFTDLFALNLCSTLLIAAVFGVAVWLSPRLQDYGLLVGIGLCKLIANLFWIEWLYTGLEDFRYITLRSLILRTLFVISVFLLVRTQCDAAVYYALFVGITVGNAVCNWYHKRTYLHWDLRRAHLRRYLIPFFMLGLFAMLSAFYTKLSLPVLSFLTDDHEAGSYATATRVFQVIIALVSALAGVMIPRMSVLMKEGQFDQVRSYTDTSFRLLFWFAAPVICFTEIFAPDIIRIFAGSGFDDAILPMRIVMLQLIVVGAEQIVVRQLLIPYRSDRAIVRAGILGVAVWLALTIALVPLWHSVGTCIVWIAAELTVLVVATIETRRSLDVSFPFRLFLLSCLYAVPYIMAGLLVAWLTPHPVVRLLVAAILFTAYALLLENKVYKTGILASAISKISRRQ